MYLIYKEKYFFWYIAYEKKNQIGAPNESRLNNKLSRKAKILKTL